VFAVVSLEQKNNLGIHTMKFCTLTLAALACSALLAGLPVLAADAKQTTLAYPVRSVRLIVPYSAGGGSDVLARQISARLLPRWGQAVLVENRAGASGNIGSEAVVHAEPDGYTLLLQNSTMVVNPAVNGKLNYDPENDLTPIMLLGLTPIALVSSQTSGLHTLKALVEYSKANPTVLSYGSCGVGTPQHFVMELIKQKTGIDATHVGYRGCASALVDVLGAQLQLAMLSANLAAPHIKTGKLNAVGISSSARYKLLPQVASFEDQGLRPLDFSIWYALMGPAKMPPEVVRKIFIDVQKVLAEPGVIDNLANAGVEPFKGDGFALAKLIKTDTLHYAELAKSANIKAE
jgi:tripartite-type tricarboxylate transporter receptor subunit TctC